MSRLPYRAHLLLVALSLGACNDAVTTPGRDDRHAAAGDAPAISALAAGSPRDVAAMEAIVSTLDAAWTGQDPVTYAAQYAGAEWIGPNGAVQTNPAIITAIYTGILTVSPLAGSVRQSTIRSLTFLTGTIAVLDIDARVTGFAALPPGIVPWQPGIVRALEKNILMKREGEWRIVRHQQTAVAPGV